MEYTARILSIERMPYVLHRIETQLKRKMRENL